MRQLRSVETGRRPRLPRSARLLHELVEHLRHRTQQRVSPRLVQALRGVELARLEGMLQPRLAQQAHSLAEGAAREDGAI